MCVCACVCVCAEEVRHGDSLELELQSIHSNHVKLEVINNNKMIWNVLIEAPSRRVVPPLVRVCVL